MRITLAKWARLHGVAMGTARNWLRCGLLVTGQPSVPATIEEDESPPVIVRGRPRKETSDDER
jgi:predicted site-specific integrase-resolvase